MSEWYGGLDVSDLTTAVCVLDGAGKPVLEETVATDPKAIMAALAPYKKVLSKVGQESGSKAPWLHKELVKKRLPMICLDARLASAALKHQRNKTDKNDARALARLLRTGWRAEAYIKSDEAFRLRLLLTNRNSLRRQAVTIEATLRSSLKVFGATLQKTGKKLTIKQSTKTPDPMLTQLSETMIHARSMLLKDMQKLDDLIVRLARADPVCVRLMTIPGVGPLTSLTFRAAVDDPFRFSSSRNVAAHFGLTPRRYQSGQTDITGHISRIGDETVRTVLYEAAFSMLSVSKKPSALRTWGLKLSERIGAKPARVAVARKLAVIMHRMWVTNRDFDPNPQRV